MKIYTEESEMYMQWLMVMRKPVGRPERIAAPQRFWAASSLCAALLACPVVWESSLLQVTR